MNRLEYAHVDSCECEAQQGIIDRRCLDSLKGDIFVVVCKDRHTDDDVTVCFTRDSADAVLDAFLDEYNDEEFVEDDCGAPEWVRCVHADHDDGPKAHIERQSYEGDS